MGYLRIRLGWLARCRIVVSGRRALDCIEEIICGGIDEQQTVFWKRKHRAKEAERGLWKNRRPHACIVVYQTVRGLTRCTKGLYPFRVGPVGCSYHKLGLVKAAAGPNTKLWIKRPSRFVSPLQSGCIKNTHGGARCACPANDGTDEDNRLRCLGGLPLYAVAAPCVYSAGPIARKRSETWLCAEN